MLNRKFASFLLYLKVPSFFRAPTKPVETMYGTTQAFEDCLMQGHIGFHWALWLAAVFTAETLAEP